MSLQKLIFEYIDNFRIIKVKVTSFGTAAFSYLAAQPPFDILNSPGH